MTPLESSHDGRCWRHVRSVIHHGWTHLSRSLARGVRCSLSWNARPSTPSRPAVIQMTCTVHVCGVVRPDSGLKHQPLLQVVIWCLPAETPGAVSLQAL